MFNEQTAREFCLSHKSIRVCPVMGLWVLRIQISCRIGGKPYKTWRDSWEESAAVVGVLLDMQEQFGVGGYHCETCANSMGELCGGCR